MIRGGRVRVNGTVVRDMGVTVEPERDRVELDGRRVTQAPRRWLALNKPPGVLCTRRDPGGGRTVFDLLDPPDPSLRYVGRLDRDTDGLLLLTNDGDRAHALTHPSSAVEREYVARVVGRPGPAVVARLREGVELADGFARPHAVRLERDAVRLVLTEGRNREVRRLLDAVGHPVRALTRVRFGPVRLGTLAEGEIRPLADAERDALHHILNP